MTQVSSIHPRDEAYASLMSGISELDLQGTALPSNLVLIGDHALPLAMNTRGQVLMAASRYGSGRLVVLGHESYLAAFPALVENALVWLRGPARQVNPTVGLHSSCSSLLDQLNRSNVWPQLGGLSEELGVYVTDAYSVGEDVKRLVDFMKAGGGLLLAGQAGHWAHQNPGQNPLLGFPGNQVSSVAGIYFSDQYGTAECLSVPRQIPSSWLTVAIGKNFKDDLDLLLKGVTEFDIQRGSVASEVLVHGPLAFPIGSTQDGRAFLAGAYYGQGRVIVVTHEAYIWREELRPFWLNAIHWLDEGRNGLVGVQPQLNSAHSLLSQSGLACEKTSFRKELSVFVCTSYSDEHAEEIRDFVAEGGGLLIGGHAWNWAQAHSGQNELTDYPGNRILNRMGLSILGATLEEGCYSAPTPGQDGIEGYHFRRLLQRFASHVTSGEELTSDEEAHLKKLGRDCASYLKLRANNSSSYDTVVSTLTDIVKQADVPQICQTSPVSSAKDHLLLNVGSELYKTCLDPDALLPHLIKDRPDLPVLYNARIKLSARTAGGEEWISTGLYLSPAMRTDIAMPPEIVNQGWKVQIGCQTDYIGNAEELKRAPSVCEQFPVDSEMIQVWNLWGGLIYLVAPPNTEVEEAEVVVQVAVLAPYYKSGVTSIADWMTLRTAPAPWAELEFENIIMTVPSEMVRGLDSPDKLAGIWDDIMRAIADLAAKPAKFPRKERFVADVQISHGWMHAGYPIMMHSSSAPEMLNVKGMLTSGLWGPIHELGHNQQRGVWEFPPNTIECTCNLWSVYVNEEVLNVNRARAHPSMTLDNRQSRVEQYARGGRNLAAWEMWIALETYMQLQDEFGWEAFKKVFAAYHNMQDVPGDNPGKMNVYAQTFSQVVERNLAPFFKAWGWPIVAATEEKLSSLPVWKDHPMASTPDLERSGATGIRVAEQR